MVDPLEFLRFSERALRRGTTVGNDQNASRTKRAKDAPVKGRFRGPSEEVMQRQRGDDGIGPGKHSVFEPAMDERGAPSQPATSQSQHFGVAVNAGDVRFSRQAKTSCGQRARANSQIENFGRAARHKRRSQTQHFFVMRNESTDAAVVLYQPDSEMCGDAHGRSQLTEAQ